MHTGNKKYTSKYKNIQNLDDFMLLLVIFVQVNKSNSSKDKGNKFTSFSHTLGRLVVLIPGLIFQTKDRCPCCGGHRYYPFSPFLLCIIVRGQ